MFRKIQDISELKDSDIWKVEADQDLHLEDYFLEIPAYKELVKTDKFIVSWRKGTWKTALKSIFYKRFKDNKEYQIDDIAFTDIYTASFFDSFFNEPDTSKTYIDEVKLVLLIRMMNIIVDDSSILTDQKDYLRDFLVQNWFRLASLSNLFTEIRTKRVIKVKRNSTLWVQFPWWFSGNIWNEKEESSEVSSIDISNVLPDLQSLLIWMLNINKNYIFLIDKIDDFWTSYFNIYDWIVISFINAIKDLNYAIRKHNQIYSSKHNSRFIIFIREDMLDKVKWKDWNINKIIQDDLIKIDRQNNYNDENSLLTQMITKRIKKACSTLWLHYDEKSDFLTELLQNSRIPQAIKKDFDTRKKKISLESQFLKYVLYNRTYLKPRDFIKYFHFLTKATNPIEFEKSYSHYLRQEISNEISPVIKDIVRTEKTLKKICQTLHTWKFQSNDFIDFYINIISDDNIEDLNSSTTAQKTLEKLFDYSIIWTYEIVTENGYSKNTGSYDRTITHVRYKYRETDSTSYDPTKTLIIHAWLYTYLWLDTALLNIKRDQRLL